MPTGMTMSIVGGHGDFKVGLNGEQNASHLVNGPEDMRRAVREQFTKGAKNVKLMATGGIMSLGDEVDDTELSLEEMKMAVSSTSSPSDIIPPVAINLTFLAPLANCSRTALRISSGPLTK